MRKRPGDGIVYIEQALCIGCKNCIMARLWGACQWNPTSRKAVKRDYCKDRLDKGQKPACVIKCLTQLMEFVLADRLPGDRRQRFAQAMASKEQNPSQSR